MEELIELIKKAEVKYNDPVVHITLYSDGSGALHRGGHEHRFQSLITTFVTLDELRTHLNE